MADKFIYIWKHYTKELNSWILLSLYIKLKSDTRKTRLPRKIIFAGWNLCKSSIICHTESFFSSNWQQRNGLFISFNKLKSSRFIYVKILYTFKSTSNMFINLKESWSFLQNLQKFIQNITWSLFKTRFFIQENQ